VTGYPARIFRGGRTAARALRGDRCGIDHKSL